MLVLYMSFIDDEIHRRLFEEIYITYRKQMFLVARAVLSNDSDAEDAVHDVFLKIAKSQMQKIGSIQEAADVRNYLLKATKHQAIDHLRKAAASADCHECGTGGCTEKHSGAVR